MIAKHSLRKNAGAASCLSLWLIHTCTCIRMRLTRSIVHAHVYTCAYVYTHIHICVYIYRCILLFSFADLVAGRRHVGSTGKVACGSPRRAPPHTHQEQPLQGRSYCAYLQATLVYICASFLFSSTLSVHMYIYIYIYIYVCTYIFLCKMNTPACSPAVFQHS